MTLEEAERELAAAEAVLKKLMADGAPRPAYSTWLTADCRYTEALERAVVLRRRARRASR